MKYWIPIFEKPKNEWSYLSEAENIGTGKSKIASIIRVVALVVAFVAVIAGIVVAFVEESLGLICLQDTQLYILHEVRISLRDISKTY